MLNSKPTQDCLEGLETTIVMGESASLPDHIEQNIDTITALSIRAEQDVTRHQRLIERTTDFFGRPTFFFSIFSLIGFWIIFNLLPWQTKTLIFDPPPFDWLDKVISLGSLLMTTALLVRQSRQELLAEQRAQLSLQLNLSSEQKVAKLIALIEELRHDIPEVLNPDIKLHIKSDQRAWE